MASPEAAGPDAVPVVLMSNGWHTELVLPAADIHGHLAAFRQAFPTARWLAFGWGEKTYFMTHHPSLAETVRAIFPAPSALLVSGFAEAPPPGHGVQRVYVSRIGLARLSHYVWTYVATSPQGAPERLAAGPWPSSAFYASTGTYDVLHTCNTWSAAALHVAGLPIHSSGVYFAAQVTDQVQHLERHRRTPDRRVAAVSRG